MNTGIDNIENFKAYLEDTTTDLESDGFTRALIQQYYQEEALKMRWQKLLQKEHRFSIETTPTRQAKSKRSPILIIGSIMAIAACLLLVWNSLLPPAAQNIDPIDQLLSQHYAKPYTRSVVKGPSENSVRNAAYDLYQAQDYAQAIPLLEQIIASPNQTETDHFFLGLSYLYNDQPKLANARFQHILNQQNSQFTDSATWFLALGLTDAGDYAEARQYLTRVAEWSGNSGKLRLAAAAKKLLTAIDE